MIAEDKDIELKVMFGDEIGGKAFYSKEFLSEISWDVPVLEGYDYKFFKNNSSQDKKGFFSRNNPSIFKYVIKSDADFVLIHGYDTLTSWYVYLASLISFKKIIWRGEAIDPIHNTKSIRNIIKSIIKFLILPIYFLGCHRVLYSCILNKNYLSKYLILQRRKLVSFPCAVDNNFFALNRVSDENKKSIIKNEFNIPLNHLVIITCSRLTKRKRTMHILESIGSMDTKDITLLIVGDGPERAKLEKKAMELNINLVCSGFVGQKIVAKLLSISDIFVLISEYDASPKALNEAMNFPLAMIVSNGVGTSRDLVLNNRNGFILKNNNTEKLLSFLNILANDAELRIRMAKENQEIIKNYSLDIDVLNLKDILYVA